MRKRSREQKRVLAKRLAGYSLTAGAVLVMGQKASAGIVSSGPQNLVVDLAHSPVVIDLDGDSVDDFSFRYAKSYTPPATTGPPMATSIKRLEVQGLNGAEVRVATGTSTLAHRFIASDTVLSTAGTFASSAKLASYGSDVMGTVQEGEFLGQAGYLGVTFPDGGSGNNVGWIAFNANADATQGVIASWAYEDSGSSILAGATSSAPATTGAGTMGAGVVPEPSALVLFALGAAGIATSRRKRRQAE